MPSINDTRAVPTPRTNNHGLSLNEHVTQPRIMEKPIIKNNGCNPFGSVTKFNPGQA